MTRNCDGTKEDLLHGQWHRRGCSFSLKILWQLVATPEVVESVDAFARVTLPGLAQKDCVLFRDELVLLALPLRLQIEVTVQTRAALALESHRTALGSLPLYTPAARHETA